MVDGLIRLMESGNELAGPVNLGNPVEISMLDLARSILRLTDSSSELAFEPSPEDDPRQRCPDIGLAQDLLGWRPSTGLQEGLARTLEYFRNRLDEDHRP